MGQRRSQAQLIVGSKWVYVTEKRGKREWVRDKSDSEPMSSQGWNDVVFFGGGGASVSAATCVEAVAVPPFSFEPGVQRM